MVSIPEELPDHHNVTLHSGRQATSPVTGPNKRKLSSSAATREEMDGSESELENIQVGVGLTTQRGRAAQALESYQVLELKV